MYEAVLMEPDLLRQQNLYPYPYDSHELEIELGIRAGEFRGVPLARVLDDDQMSKAWTRGNAIERCVHAEFVLKKEVTLVQQRDGSLHASIFIWRKYHNCENNVLLLNTLITLLAFYVYCLPLDELQPRADFGVAVLFAIVGLRFSIESSLPKVDFSTLAQRQLNISSES